MRRVVRKENFLSIVRFFIDVFRSAKGRNNATFAERKATLTLPHDAKFAVILLTCPLESDVTSLTNGTQINSFARQGALVGRVQDAGGSKSVV